MNTFLYSSCICLGDKWNATKKSMLTQSFQGNFMQFLFIRTIDYLMLNEKWHTWHKSNMSLRNI